jgi:hypothetical protein
MKFKNGNHFPKLNKLFYLNRLTIIFDHTKQTEL